MIRDSQTALFEATALTTSQNSPNTYDLGAAFSGGTAGGASVDPGNGVPLGIVIVPTVSATSNGTQTYEFDLIQSASSNLSSPDILLKLSFTTAQAATLLVAGSVLVLPIPPMSITKRFLGISYVSANSAAITVTAWICALSEIQAQRFYTNAIVVS